MLRKNLDTLVSLFYNLGVRKWVISPGSRNAPVIAGFIRHGGFELFSFPDERSGGFAALGMSSAEGSPCGILTTSGTAAANLYPAVCEAYYQRIPLVVVTADRPEEWIDQWDGQTIYQNGIFGNHCLLSMETPQNMDNDDAAGELSKLIGNGVKTCQFPVKGPVHLNIPLREPIYEGLNTPFQKQNIVTGEMKSDAENKPDLSYLKSELMKYKKILLVAGQMLPDDLLKATMRTASMEFPLIADITSNLSAFSVGNWDLALSSGYITHDLKPDLLITFGLSVVSKSLKLFLRKNKPQMHWHISTGGFTGDPFETNPETKLLSPLAFIESLTDLSGVGNLSYLNTWRDFCSIAPTGFPENKPEIKIEFNAVQQILKDTDDNTALHLGNSMAVRYASWAGKSFSKIYCNRGTSGIDGSLSTAVGYALAKPSERVLCVIGDISFLYDSNALWTNKVPDNLGIIVLNNQRGLIFDFIPGPDAEKRLAPWIQTPHTRGMKYIAGDFEIPYKKRTFNNVKIVEELSEKTPFILELVHETN